MSATTFSRSAVAARLFDLVAASDDVPDDILVARSIRATTDRRGEVFQGRILGDETGVPTMKRGTLTYRDQYRIEVFCVVWVEGDHEFAQADAEVEALAEIVRAVCASNPHLTVDDSTLCVTSAVVTLADGPDGYHTDNGSASAMRLEVSIDQRITSEES